MITATSTRNLILLAAVLAGTSNAFSPPLTHVRPTSSTSSSSLYMTNPEPLATEGDWSAYLDSETTGYIYYFNGVTGESTWEPPTDTFPALNADDAMKEQRRKERREKRAERGGGVLSGFFKGGGDKGSTSTTVEQLQELENMASNTQFLSELDSVIAEAEEAIAIADKIEKAPPQNKGGFFSTLRGFVSGEEAVEEVETLIADAEERTANIFEGIGFGTAKKAEPKKAATTSAAVEKRESPPPQQEEQNVWVEGLKNLFTRTFGKPPTTTTSKEAKKVVAVEETIPTKTQKADVSDSDFLDVIWGAETSARPTLNSAEMMKAFQVQTTTADDKVVKVDDTDKFKTVELEAALQVKPHPEKVSWGGEDYGFSVGRTFGVFDGVSGAEKEMGKQLYSKFLSESMKKKIGKDGLSIKEITDYMTEAKVMADEMATGATTAVVASIGEDNVLRALNLGDSVCLVLRDGAVAARTREIIHFFDCPYQLGDDSPDRPKDGTTLQAEIFPGDIIVAGSDGVFDNLSDADVCDIVGSFGPRAKAAQIAKKIVDKSRVVSLDTSAVTPYSTVARGRSGYDQYKSGRGGKVDDISCIVVKAS
jgi:protein phosphatase PTC7